MFKTGKRILAAWLAVTLAIAHVPAGVFAEDSTEEAAVMQEAETAVTEAPTEAPPETEPPTEAAPETEPPTEAAPVTEAPSEAPPETEAPPAAEEVPAEETVPSASEQPQEESAASSPETAPGQDPLFEEETKEQKETEKETEKQTETETESETEEKELTDTLTGSLKSTVVTVKLSKSDRVPEEDAEVIVTRIRQKTDPSDYQKLWDKLASAVNHRQRKLSDAYFYRVELKVDGKTWQPKQNMTVTFQFKEPKDLGLEEDLDPETGVYAVDGSAQRIADVDVNGSRQATGFTVTGRSFPTLGVAGVQNRKNDGAPAGFGTVSGALGILSSYAAAAGQITGDKSFITEEVLSVELLEAAEAEEKETEDAEDAQEKTDPEKESDNNIEDSDSAKKDQENSGAGEDAQEAATEDEAEKGAQEEAGAEGKTEGAKEETGEEKKLPSSYDIKNQLDVLAGSARSLANAVSSAEAVVINLYADENGNIPTEPVVKAMNGQSVIDVTNHLVIVNVIAASSSQSLVLPAFAVADGLGLRSGEEGAGNIVLRQGAGRLIYNLAVLEEDGKTFSDFTGSVTAPANGVVIAPYASVSVGGVTTGAVYAGSIYASEGARVTAAMYSESEEDEEAQTEEETEALTEAEEGETEEASTEEETEETEEIETEEITEAEEPLAADAENAQFLISAVKSGTTDLIGGTTFTVTYISGTEKNVTTDPEKLEGSNAPLNVKIPLGETVNEELYQLLEASASTPKSVTVTVKPGAQAQPDGMRYTLVPEQESGAEIRISREEDNNLTVSSDSPLWNAEKQTLTFEYTAEAVTVALKAAATVNGSVKDLTKFAGYTLKDAGELPEGAVTLDAGTKMLVFDIAAIQQAIADKKAEMIDPENPDAPLDPVTFTVKVSESTVPPLFNLSSNADRTLTIKEDPEAGEFGFTISEGSTVLNPAEGLTWQHNVKKQALSFEIHSVDEKDAELPGAEYTVTSGSKNYTAQADGSGANFTVTIADWSDLDAFSKLTDDPTKKTTAEIKVSESKIPTDYTLESDKDQTVTVIWENGAFSVSPGSLTYKHKEIPTTGKLKITLTDTNGKNRNGDFIVLDKNGKTVAEISTSKGKVTLKDDDYDFLTKAGTYTIKQTGFPENYFTAEGTSPTAKVTVEAHKDNDLEAAFINDTGTSSETIRITKRLYVGNSSMDNYGMIYSASKNTTFYVALYSDSGRTKRVSGFYELTVQKGHPYKVLTISNVPAGTYYIGESTRNEDGALVPTSAGKAKSVWVTYSKASGESARGKVTLSGGSSRHSVTLANRYLSLLDGYSYLAPIAVKKIVYAEENKIDTTFNGKVRIRASYGSVAQTLSVQVTNGESGTNYFYIPLGKTGAARTVKISELTEKQSSIAGTAILANGKTYKVKIDQPTLSVQRGQTVPSVTVSNTEVKTPEDETEEGDEKTQAELKLTKKVVYKNTPIRVNSVYYIGIFDDASHKKLRYKKALQFKNASEMTASLKINLYKLKSREVTFYFAEVDKDGKLVQSGGSGGYEISQNKPSITLNPKNLEDEVVITNSVLQGSRREQQLTDPSSGFAGDRAALAEAQQLENDKNAGINTSTGDKTPIVPWAFVLVMSLSAAAVILTLKKRVWRG